MRIFGMLLSMTVALTANCFASERVLDIQHWNSNGARVYFVAAPQVPILDIQLAFDAGSGRDGKQFGLAALTNNLLNEGSGQYSATQIAEQFEDVGAIFQTTARRTMAGLSLRTLTQADSLKSALKTFETVLSQARFENKAIERERSQLLSALRQSQESPQQIASNAFFKELYPSHPYGHPVLGSETTIPKLDTADIQRFYRHYYSSNNLVIAMVGAIDRAQAEKIAQQLTSRLPRGQSAKALPAAKPLEKAISKHIKHPSKQTIIRMGQLGIDRHNSDYFPLLVGNYTLGGGSLVSRLADEIREKRGLSYGISSRFSPMPAKGPFIIGLATKTGQASNARAVTQDTVERFVKKGPSTEELMAAKQYLNGSFPLHFSSNKSIAANLLNMGFYRLPLDYFDTYLARVNALTTKQIQQAFNKTLTPQKMLTVTVGQA